MNEWMNEMNEIPAFWKKCKFVSYRLVFSKHFPLLKETVMMLLLKSKEYTD